MGWIYVQAEYSTTTSTNMPDDPDTTYSQPFTRNEPQTVTYEGPTEEEILVYEKMLRDKKWFDWYRQMRAWGRAAVYQVDQIVVNFVKKVPFYLRVCTQRIPSLHFNIHNSPVRFIREGL